MHYITAYKQDCLPDWYTGLPDSLGSASRGNQLKTRIVQALGKGNQPSLVGHTEQSWGKRELNYKQKNNYLLEYRVAIRLVVQIAN